MWLSFSFQCQDLPGSQSSSPLSQMDSYSGRSMDPLLPAGEPGRKKVPETDYDVTQRYHSERHKPHVCSGSPVSVEFSVSEWLQVYFKFTLFLPGKVRRTASRASSDPETTQSSSTVRSSAELASSAWEAHLWILRLWSQCRLYFFFLTWCGLFSKYTVSEFLFSLLVPWFHAYQRSSRYWVNTGCLCQNAGMLSISHFHLKCVRSRGNKIYYKLIFVFCFFPQRSTEQMRKVPIIVLSITYKGVKFIDAANKVSYYKKAFLLRCTNDIKAPYWESFTFYVSHPILPCLLHKTSSLILESVPCKIFTAVCTFLCCLTPTLHQNFKTLIMVTKE